ncbi:MAG: type III-D CRISPR-associated protein Csx19 [Promethearchaeota archaeon]
MNEIYEIKNITSNEEKGSLERNFYEIENLIVSNLDNGSIVCWQNYQLLFGKILNGKLNFIKNINTNFDKHLIKLRAFNNQKEILIWKQLDKFKYRIRIDDNGGKNQEYIDANQIIFGTRTKSLNNGFSEVIEDRGTRLIIPSDWLQNKQLGSNNRLILKTRNYLDYNNLGQISIIDCRFLEITVMEG